MRSRFTKFTAVAAVTAGLVTAQGATAGALITHVGEHNLWNTPSSWTGAGGIPDQPTEDVRLLATSYAAVHGTFNIGGIEAATGSTLRASRNESTVGALTLNGIVPGGTTPFTTSSISRLEIVDDGVFANTGSSILTIDSLLLQNTGRIRNFPGVQGSMTLTGNVTNVLQDNALMENFGTLELNSAETAVRSFAIINNDLGGTFTHSGGNVFAFDSSQILNNATFLNTGGNLFLSGSQLFRNTKTFTQTGGNIDIGRSSFVNTNNFENVGFGNFNHNGGTTNVYSGARLLNEAFYTHNDGTLTVHGGGQFTNDAINTVNGGTVLVNAGGTLDGSGSTTLAGGAMTVNGQVIQTGVTINGGTLGGSGTVRSNVNNIGGTVGPGNSPGTLTVDGNFTQGPGGTLAIEIDALAAFDVLDITGNASLDGTLDLQVAAACAATAVAGDSFTILEWTSFSGAFSTVTGLNFAAGKFFSLDYGATGLTLTVNDESVVAASEPGMIALFGLGLAGLAGLRRPKKI
jgi:hypothetical protein